MTQAQLRTLYARDQEIALSLRRLEQLTRPHPDRPGATDGQLQKVAARSGEALRFIRSIEDDEIRLIFILRYLERLPWARVARQMGYQDESAPRKRHSRYLKNSARQLTIPACPGRP